jgi:hypothetical protein
MAPCKDEAQVYRQCLKDARSSGRKCTHLAKTLEACREKWRNDNQIQHEFDGTRILPNLKCKPINEKVQHCLKWKRGDQSKCQESIGDLKACMAAEEGVVAPPTEGDKIWSDYKGSE